ncbi:MAG: hypothetical protein HY047_14855 [Acidobacteria bacterium]|nr:hypothetical protein [Acidobacteriota bacterium]
MARQVLAHLGLPATHHAREVEHLILKLLQLGQERQVDVLTIAVPTVPRTPKTPTGRASADESRV